MYLFSENIEQFEGQAVKVYINHKVYGDQVLNIRKFQPLCDDDKIGFMVGQQEIFVYLNEVENVEAYVNVYIIRGGIQDIIIEKG